MDRVRAGHFIAKRRIMLKELNINIGYNWTAIEPGFHIHNPVVTDGETHFNFYLWHLPSPAKKWCVLDLGDFTELPMNYQIGTILKYRDHGQLYPAQQVVRWEVVNWDDGMSDRIYLKSTNQERGILPSRKWVTYDELEKEFEIA